MLYMALKGMTEDATDVSCFPPEQGRAPSAWLYIISPWRQFVTAHDPSENKAMATEDVRSEIAS